MQTISWSPQLINAVKNFKKLDVSTLNERKMMNSYHLSGIEVQAVKSVLAQDKGSVVSNTWW